MFQQKEIYENYLCKKKCCRVGHIYKLVSQGNMKKLWVLKEPQTSPMAPPCADQRMTHEDNLVAPTSSREQGLKTVLYHPKEELLQMHVLVCEL